MVSEVSDKMSKYGVKVLPDITNRTNTNAIIISQPVTSEKQTAAAASPIPISSASSTVVIVDPHAASFDEVDLPLPRSNLVDDVPSSRTTTDKTSPTSNLVSSLKDANVKKALVMSYQNLKEKITQRVHKSNSTASPKLERNAFHSQQTDDSNQVDDSKMEHIDLRLRSDSVSSTEADDELVPKAAKRKAPRPPEASLDASSGNDERSSAVGIATGDFNLLNEIDNEVKKNSAEGDCDSEMEETNCVLSTTIELNASHITIHHGADDTSRKAASLGDLSKIEGDGPRTQPLERAVSLELAEHTPRASKKRKAPRPPEESTTINGGEDRCDSVGIEPGANKLKKSSLFGTLEVPSAFMPSADVVIAPIAAPKLKKSSLFGTLEEAVKTTTKLSDTEEPTTSNHNSMVASTPLKVTRVHMDGWHTPAQNDEYDDDDNSDDEIAPALPTSPVPMLPPMTTFVTEIDVEVMPSSTTTSGAFAAAIAAPTFALSDNENVQDATLFTTAAELNFSCFSDDEQATSMNGDIATSIGGIGNIDDDSRDECSSMDTVKEMSHNQTTLANPPSTVPNSPPATQTPSATPSSPTIISTPSTTVSSSLSTDSTCPSTGSSSVISGVSANFASTVAKFQNNFPAPAKLDDNEPCAPKNESAVSCAIAKLDATSLAEESSSSKTNNSRSNSSSSSTSSMSSTSTRSVNSSSSVNGSVRTSPRRFSSGGGIGVESRIKSPNATVKSSKLSQSVSPVRAVGSRIPVRANTEPSLKVSLFNKDDSPTKSKKYEGALENGKVNFVLPNHIANLPHKTALSDVRHNGPNR